MSCFNCQNRLPGLWLHMGPWRCIRRTNCPLHRQRQADELLLMSARPPVSQEYWEHFFANYSQECNWKSETRSQVIPRVQQSIQFAPFPLQLPFSSLVLLHWDGSMKPCALRLANGQTHRAGRSLGPTSLLLSWGFPLPARWTILSHCTVILCLEPLQSSPLRTPHHVPSITMASSFTPTF